MLHCSLTSPQVNIPIQFIYILRNLCDFLPFWLFLIFFFPVSQTQGLKECHSVFKVFPRTIIFMDMTASYLLSSVVSIQFSSAFCYHFVFSHVLSRWHFQLYPKLILTLQHNRHVISSIIFKSFHLILCPKNNHLHYLWLHTNYFML